MTDPQTFGDAARAWCEYRRRLMALDLVRGTTVANQTRIAIVLADHIGGYPLDQLRKSSIEMFVGVRLKTCCALTVRGEINVLRQILNWCEDEGVLTVKPRLPTVRVDHVETSLPSDAAFEYVLRHLRPPHSLAMEFMMLTGLSPHEMERLQVRDYVPATIGFASDQKPGYIGIGQREDFHVKQPSRRRRVPLSDRAATIWAGALCGRGNSDTLVAFPNTEAITKAIQRLKHGARFGDTVPSDVDRITPKLARKWFASKVAGQHPEHVLQRLLGHSPGSRITREHYVRSTDAQTVDAVQGLEL